MSRRVGIGAADPNWAGAVAVALDAAGIEAVVVGQPDTFPDDGVDAAVLAFDPEGLRKAIEFVDPPFGTLAIGPDDPELMIGLLEAGAMGYLTADAGFDDIADAVGQLLDGHAVVPPAALGTLLRRIVERRRAQRGERSRLDGLTPREREVLELVAQGRDNEQIAAALFISAGTARTHLQRVFKKIDVHSRAEAVAFCARSGLDMGRASDD